MRIMSLNVEGIKHYECTLTFLESSEADVICLQEATLFYEKHFRSLGYTTEFLPSCTKTKNEKTFVDGILIASKHSVTFTTHRYFLFPGHDLPSETHHSTKERHARHRHGLILANILYNGTTYTIGTTHFTWTPDGCNPNEAQQTDMEAFLAYIKKQPPHVMTGDFNIPRKHNHLYENLTAVYTDAIPPSYQSSLDRDNHRCGSDPDKCQLFEKFMVDYIQKNYPA